jgi:DNA modification methylase
VITDATGRSGWKHATKSGNEYAPTGTRNRRSVWTVTTAPFKGAHFATFPPKLIEPCVLAGCPECGTVLDPFNGAGTTGVVTMQQGRKYIGIELNPEYVAIAEARIRAEERLF